jgi:two-component system, chemotaxis family, protein-glutamate methylesterase/glutaminase
VAVVQDPDDALFSGMPESALEHVGADHCLPLDEIAPLLARLAREPTEKEGAYAVPDDVELESKLAGLDPSTIDSVEHPGELSAFTCPECSGPLYEIRDGELLRFRCRVGHAYTADSVLDEKSEVLENALYTALNTLEESAAMSDRLAGRSRKDQREHAAARFEKRAREARRQAAVIRRILTKEMPEAPPDAV